MKHVRMKQLAGVAAVLAVGLTGCVETGRTGVTAGVDCPWEPDDSIDTTVVIAYQTIPNGDLVVKDQGILEACMPNAGISWKLFSSGGDVVQAFGSDSVDIGLMGSSPATIAASEPLNMPISVVWIHDIIGDAESLIAREDNITSIEDLKGKKVAVPFSSTAHFSLLQALNDAGMDSANDVKLINLDPEKMPAAWQGDEIDAAWVWNPVLSDLLEDGHAVLSSADTAAAGKPTYDLGVADNAFMEQNPEFMTQWAKAQDYAVGLIADDPDTAAESVAVAAGINPDEAKKLLAGYTYLSASEQASADHLGDKMGKDLFTTAKFLLAQGGINKVSGEQVYADFVDAAPAEEGSK